MNNGFVETQFIAVNWFDKNSASSLSSKASTMLGHITGAVRSISALLLHKLYLSSA